MTGANAKVKRILVRPNGEEKQVRPSYQEYSYNFMQAGSVSQIESDGWTSNKTMTLDSTGFYPSSGSGADGEVKNYNKINCQNAKKITISGVVYINVPSTGWGNATIWGNGSNEYIQISMRANQGTRGGYGIQVQSGSNWNTSNLSTQDYNYSLEIDLVNMSAVAKMDGKADVTYTLNQTDIDKIRNCVNLQLYYNNIGVRHKSIYVKVQN